MFRMYVKYSVLEEFVYNIDKYYRKLEIRYEGYGVGVQRRRAGGGRDKFNVKYHLKNLFSLFPLEKSLYKFLRNLFS